MLCWLERTEGAAHTAALPSASMIHLCATQCKIERSHPAHRQSSLIYSGLSLSLSLSLVDVVDEPLHEVAARNETR